jgi:hypothetical protein
MNFYFDNSLLGWAVKNSSSRYVYANPRMCNYFNSSSGNILGCTDQDLIPELSGFNKNIVNDDQKVIASRTMSIALKVFSHGLNGERQAFLVEKRPWFFQDGSPGIICTWLELTNVYFSTFLRQHARRPLVFTKPSNLFTDREWEVILLLLCGERSSAIAEILNISNLTLRNRIIHCCQKAGVINPAGLLEYCYLRGWDNYIPPFFLDNRYLIIS